MEFELQPGASVCVCDGKTNDDLPYDYYFLTSALKHGTDVSWQVLSEERTILKEWKYSDIDLPGQRFFELDSWHYHHQWEFIVSYSWAFAIIPEDIAAE